MRLRSICNLSVWLSMVLTCGTVYAADVKTADCIDAHERALDLRNRSQLRASRDQWLVCAAASCPEAVRNECARGVSDINGAMPTIVFEARDPSDHDLSDVAVTMDGQPLLARLEGTALAVDPGEHDFEFRSQAYPATHKRLLIREGEKGRREKVNLGDPLLPPPPTPVVNTPPVQPGPRLEPPRDEAPPSYTAQRVIGISLGVGGLACLGIAVADQFIAKGRESDSRSAAESSDPAVQATSAELHDQAKQSQTYAIVFGAAGAAALGVGLYLLISSFGDHDQRSAGPVRRLVPSVQRGSIALNFVQTY